MQVSYIELAGFRSYGPRPQRMDLVHSLTVIHADNSQGKTSLAEALEFLFTGATSRRVISGGSPSEFEGALRNAHLDETNVVYVEIGIDQDGVTNVLRRTLVQDYRGASDCESLLTLNGKDIDSVLDAGFELSNLPLAAPVLLEHTLRYVVSAKPGDRSDYFKAILEVADLEIVRAEIANLVREREQALRPMVINDVEQLAAIPLFTGALTGLTTAPAPAALVERALTAACRAVLPATGRPVDKESLPGFAAQLREELERRRAVVLPLDDLISTVPRLPDEERAGVGWVEYLEAALIEYRENVDRVDAKVAVILPMLEAALRIPEVAHLTAAADCPLCATPGGLTAVRVAAIREQLVESEATTGVSSAARQALDEAISRTDQVGTSITASIPKAASWTPDVMAAAVRSAGALGAGEGSLSVTLETINELQVLAATAARDTGTARAALASLRQQVAGLEQVDSADADSAAASCRILIAAVSTLMSAHKRVDAEVRLVTDAVRPALEAGSDTVGWAMLIELAEAPEIVVTALAADRVRLNATMKLKRAQREVTAAVQETLDRRLLDMGAEISKWWGLMRPAELTTFNEITRRGSGNRYLDVTAGLAPAAAAPTVIRNALAVLSNSQLNALGLATFLARCQLLESPLIVLDDPVPVPGSDREHSATFASGVVEGLLDSGRQVIIATHDSDLARHLHSNHQHRGVDRFEATLVDPREGTVLVRSGDDFENYLLEASGQMHSPLVGNRRAAGNPLRVATERLSKLVILAGRRSAGDATAQLQDYDGKNLKDLRPLAVTYAVDQNEPGRWAMLVRLLNDADHDAEPPTPQDLKLCYDSLRDLKRRHRAAGHDLRDI